MALEKSNSIQMSDADFRMFCEMLRSHCGLHFNAESRFLVEKRLARRIEELGLGSFSAYHLQLRNDPQGRTELAHLIDELTTNETYFFRELNQLRALIDEIIPERLLQRRWAGCYRRVSRCRARSRRPLTRLPSGCIQRTGPAPACRR